MSEASSVADPAGLAASGAARRLHPLTLLLSLSRQVPQVAIALIALRLSGPDEIRVWTGPIALLVVLALFGFTWLGWWRFSYRLDAEELRIASGIISRNVRSIPYERIQDVNLERGPLARMLGMARVRLETGSSGGGDEGVLDSVDLAEAERLRDVIRLRKALHADGGAIAASYSVAATAGFAAEAPPIFAMSLRRVLVAGVFNFSLVFFALVAALVNNLDFLLPDDLWDWRRIPDLLGLDALLDTLDLAARIVSIIAALVALVVIGLTGGIIRTLLREYGFRLDRTETGFRRRRGLITLTDVVMPLHRIQAAVIATGPVRRRLGWFELKVQSLASDSDKESDHSIAPLARAEEVRALLNETSIRWDADYPAMRGVDPAMWWVPLAFALPLPIIGIGVATMVANPLVAWLYALLPVVVAISWLHWRAHRYLLVDGQIYVRTGFWRQALTILPLRRVQSVDIRQTAISRFIGLASVQIGVAGRPGALTIEALPVENAVALRDALLS